MLFKSTKSNPLAFLNKHYAFGKDHSTVHRMKRMRTKLLI